MLLNMEGENPRGSKVLETGEENRQSSSHSVAMLDWGQGRERLRKSHGCGSQRSLATFSRAFSWIVGTEPDLKCSMSGWGVSGDTIGGFF